MRIFASVFKANWDNPLAQIFAISFNSCWEAMKGVKDSGPLNTHTLNLLSELIHFLALHNTPHRKSTQRSGFTHNLFCYLNKTQNLAGCVNRGAKKKSSVSWDNHATSQDSQKISKKVLDYLFVRSLEKKTISIATWCRPPCAKIKFATIPSSHF